MKVMTGCLFVLLGLFAGFVLTAVLGLLPSMHAGRLGEVLENGDEYDEQDVQSVAMYMLKERS